MKSKTIQVNKRICAKLNPNSITFYYQDDTINISYKKLKKFIEQIFQLQKFYSKGFLTEFNWSEVKSRTSFTAIIDNIPCTGKIQKERRDIYLCQNVKSGASCSNKLRYKYSWTVGSGQLEICDTKMISFAKTPKSEMPVFINPFEEYANGEVKIYSDCIKIGCQEITNKEINKIYKYGK